MRTTMQHALSFALALSFCAQLSADQQDQAQIHNSLQGYSGNAMVNQAAGSAQQQVNARAIAAGEHASVQVRQQRDQIAEETGQLDASSHITGNAFSAGNGILGVNQSAGVGNQQINAFRLGFGALPESLDDSGLAQSAAPLSLNSGAEVPNNGERLVEIDDQAFVGSRGAVQLNQSAGVGNRSVNNLGIRIID
ncbi:adhesin [Halopseudomonas phragmitis]|nr:adhesin [Halopseudomonas phragmitis]